MIKSLISSSTAPIITSPPVAPAVTVKSVPSSPSPAVPLTPGRVIFAPAAAVVIVKSFKSASLTRSSPVPTNETFPAEVKVIGSVPVNWKALAPPSPVTVTVPPKL